MSNLDIGQFAAEELTILAAVSLSQLSRSIKNRNRESFVSGISQEEDSTQNVGCSPSFGLSQEEPFKQTVAPLVYGSITPFALNTGEVHHSGKTEGSMAR